MWIGIKIILTYKAKCNQIPTKVYNNSTDLTEPKAIANAFNQYFANIGNNLAKSIPDSDSTPRHYLNNQSYDTFYLFPISASEIEAEIYQLNESKATGPYSLKTKILKLVKSVLSKPLEILFNTSFAKGIVPDRFKIPRVLPVFKKGLQTTMGNYRPTSLLSVFNRILERLIYNRLINFIEKMNIIYAKQIGFCSKHSTEHAILNIVANIHKGIENGKFSCGIFLDLSKAFDTVNHAILIKKLEHCGIRGLAKEWFISYLHNKKQFTSIGNTNSEELPISCGVPQGSVLGPLLFLLFINDFKNCTSSLDLHLFADDSNFFFSHKNLAQLEMIINVELVHVQTWLSTNKLSLNIDKSNYVFFHPPQKKVNISIKLNINDTSLKEKPCIKYLGIMLDSNLNWKSHVNCISTKIKRSICILSKMRYLVTLDVLINLYYTLIYPLVVWGKYIPY